MKSDDSTTATGEGDLRSGADDGVIHFNDIGEITTYAIGRGYNPEFHRTLERFFLSENMNMVDKGGGSYSIEPL